jgi:cytosine/adenosine deaminase-related metal-dependent hydrolase
MHSTMRCASGKVLTQEGFIDGYVGFEDGVVVEVAKGRPETSIVEGVITPTLVNAHTHLADCIVPMDLSMCLEDLVAPPNGLKHRMLGRASEDEIFQALLRMGALMRGRGVSRYIDFREGGETGARMLSLARGKPEPTIMGRPMSLTFDKEEVRKILQVADGIGVSSISDWDYGTLSDLSAFVRSQGKRFAIHASERVREDIDQVLDLEPAFVVHMTQASGSDIESCAQAKVPIVACPRSNMFFGNLPPLATMLEKGAIVALGTDNAMLALPDILVEMEFAARLLRTQGVKDVRSVLDMAISSGRKLLNQKIPIGIEPGMPCDFMVTRPLGGDPATDLVLRGSSADPLMVCMGLELWSGPR